MKKVLELKEIRSKDKNEIFKEIDMLNVKLIEMQTKNSLKELKNFRQIRDLKRKRSRLWTVLNEKLNEEIEKRSKE